MTSLGTKERNIKEKRRRRSFIGTTKVTIIGSSTFHWLKREKNKSLIG
jgi:hypothetical protein